MPILAEAKPSRRAQFVERIDPSSDPEGCWLWAGYRHPTKGYGRFGPREYAHRVSWELVNGPIPKGLHVLHRCDNPPCVNPAHLFLGTHQDNMADRNAKGRQASGERSGARTHPERFSRRGRMSGSEAAP